MWSPTGLQLGFELSNWSGSGPQYMCVLDPMSGQMMKYPQTFNEPRSYFYGWVDAGRFFECVGGYGFIRQADGGEIIERADANMGCPLYPCPPSLPGKWVTMWDGAIRYLKPGFKPGKVIWVPPRNDAFHPNVVDYPMGIDPSGEWIAWSEHSANAVRTAFKHTASAATMPPYYIRPMRPGSMSPSALGAFTAWTDDGNMLFMMNDGMAIVSKEGEVRRLWKTDSGLNPGRGSWRRYTHQ
jgi:hypothetical protein